VCDFDQLLQIKIRILEDRGKVAMYSPAYGKSHRVTILCVDDDEMALLVRKMVLESAGYIVFTAASSSKGLEIFKQHHAIY
jgi:PleD family two-component response regulator